jgi:tetratricopeptide (TPR) repeat protein
MWLFFAMVVCGSVLITAWYYWKPFFENDRFFKQSDFIAWTVKGLSMPMLFWILFNRGDLLVNDVGKAMIVLTTWWLALSLLWIFCVLIKNTPDENRIDFRTHLIFWSFIMVPVAGLFVAFGGWFVGGFAASAWLLPIVHYTTPLLVKPKTTTFYSAAIARMKMGKFEEAEAEILKQLEDCENDFDGWMMLAELYAVHFHDLDTADQTIRDLCLQPDLNPGQVYTALTRLADWHLKLGDDPIAARTALEIVCKAYAGTHLGRLAEARLSQVPRSRADLLERRQGRKIRLPSLRDDLESSEPESSRVEAAAAANDCVNRLKSDPDDVATREKLARLFAEQLGRADMGIEQTKLLLEMPNQPDSKIVEWLAQIAAWQIKYQRNTEAGREILQRIIAEYPQSPQAFAAQRRMNLLTMEARLRNKTGSPTRIGL